jgi:hypothetical protein
MDISRYKELKTKGLTRLEKNEDEKVELIVERFDLATGNKIEPERENIEAYTYNLQMYKDQLVDIQTKIDNSQELISDVEKFKGGKDAR